MASEPVQDDYTRVEYHALTLRECLKLVDVIDSVGFKIDFTTISCLSPVSCLPRTWTSRERLLGAEHEHEPAFQGGWWVGHMVLRSAFGREKQTSWQSSREKRMKKSLNKLKEFQIKEPCRDADRLRMPAL